MHMRLHFVLLGCLLGPVAVQAQTSFGYLNSMEIIYVMPEMKDVQKKLTDYSAELDEEFKKMTEGYRKLEADYKANASKWSETIRQLKEDELYPRFHRMMLQSRSNKEKKSMITLLY